MIHLFDFSTRTVRITRSKLSRFLHLLHIFTTRKRSLGQGYSFTGVCHSVNRGVYQGDPPPGRPPPWRPPCQGDSPGRETPRQGDPPPGRTPPGRPCCQGDPPARETPTRETPHWGDTPLLGRPPTRETPLPGRLPP